MAEENPKILVGEIRHGSDLRKWLGLLNKELRLVVAPVLASRAALRACIFVVDDARADFQSSVLPIFRANLTTQIALKSTNSEILRATHAAYNIVENTAGSPPYAAYAAADAANTFSGDPDIVADRVSTAADNSVFAASLGFLGLVGALSAPESIWQAISDDIVLLSEGLDPVKLNERPIFLNGAPEWWVSTFEKLKSKLFENAKNETELVSWQVWIDWLQAKKDGTPAWNFRPSVSQEIELRIALGDGRKDFWDRESDVINTEIAGWLQEKGWKAGETDDEPKFDFFLSFTKDDRTEAKFISDTLEDNGYSVFSQLNDMRTGNFIDHMNTGLKGMARFLAAYSPDYFASNACKAEFQAALTFDPSGNNGKFVPFMVRTVAPPPLLRGIIYHSLFGLSQDDKAKTILQAITEPVSPRDRVLQRQAAKSALSPDVVVDPAGRRIDSGKNAEYDDIHADTDLFDLPERMRQIVDQLLLLLAGKNNCHSIQLSLKTIHGELSAGGLDCSIGLLADQIEFIEIDLHNGDAALLASNDQTGARFRKLADLFALMRSHYPLDQKREAILRQAEVEIKTPVQIEEFHRQVSEAVQNAAEDDLVTDQYQQVIENRIRVTRDILSIPDPVVPMSDDVDFVAREEDRLVRVQSAKRRALAQDAAVADKTIEVAASLATIADSTAGNALIEVMRRLGNWIWGA